jgi:tetratricopeptide (TPR) repeat protein
MGETERARADYHLLGTRATTDDDRFAFLLKEADCLEAGHRYDDELALLQEAAGHEQEPPRPGPTQTFTASTASNERWGRLMIRMGAVDMIAGRSPRALETFRRVVDLFPRTALAAEAQYRVGYTYETSSDDFDRARTEYGKVNAMSVGSQFATQAALRLASLDRLAQYRSGAGPDSVGKKAEAGFLLAEQYLFQLDKPDRAIEQYRTIAHDFAGTEYAGKALNAEAWVLRNKYDRKAMADSVLWVVVRNYPKTEAQLNARDYLERFGQTVPDDLIQPPDPPRPAARDTAPPALTPPPAQVDSIGIRHRAAAMDSLLRMGMIRAGEMPSMQRPPIPTRHTAPDTERVVPIDTLRTAPAPRDSSGKHP